MKKLTAAAFAALFATVSMGVTVIPSIASAAEGKKPTAEQCKKDPKMKGCEAAKK